MRLSIGTLTATLVLTLVLANLPVAGQQPATRGARPHAAKPRRASSPVHAQNAPRAEVAVLRETAAAAINSDPEKALASLLRAKMLAPADPAVLFEFAMAALRLTLHEDAAAALTRARKLRPNEPKYLYALARARMALGDLRAAESLLRQYTQLRPQDATGHFGLGYVLAGLRRNEQARVAFAQSLALHAEQTESPYQLGLLAYADGELEAAATWFERVLRRAPQHTGALLGMGQVYFNRKEYEQARESLEQAIALDSSLVKAHYQLGLTAARLGDQPVPVQVEIRSPDRRAGEIVPSAEEDADVVVVLDRRPADGATGIGAGRPT